MYKYFRFLNIFNVERYYYDTKIVTTEFEIVNGYRLYNSDSELFTYNMYINLTSNLLNISKIEFIKICENISKKIDIKCLWNLPYNKHLILKTVEIGYINGMLSVRYSNFICEYLIRKKSQI